MKAKNAPGRFLGQSNRFVLFVRHGWPAKPLNICSAPPEIDTELRELLWQNKEAGGGFEVRLSDSGWSQTEDRNLVGRFTTQTFTVTRFTRLITYYVKQYDNSFPPKYSRNATALHVDYPL